jgi:carotenoid cleavage dioxygenase-like enzyme
MAQTGLLDRAAGWVAQQMQRRVPYNESNPFLEGPFAPVLSETTATQLAVTGTIPMELNGVLARIGPNPIHVENPATYHWFLGDGMVHGLRMRDGKAQWYRNRWVGTDSANRALGRPPVPGQQRGISDVVNTNIIGHGGRLWALVEAGTMPVEMDAELNTVKHGLFDSDVSAAFTAHPHRDPQTGELHAVCYDATRPNRIQYLAVSPDCRLLHKVDIPVQHGPMIHDCAITETRVVLLDLPVTFSLGAVFRGAGFPYQWNPDHAARVGLIPKHGSAADVRWFSVDPCYVFHTCNAYDLEDGGAILDVVVHDRMFDRSRQGPDSQRITFERWWLDPVTRRVERTVRSDARQEFPRFDERLAGHHYRYAYTVGADVDGARTMAQPLYRYDLLQGSVQRHDYGTHHLTGEAVFVPRHASAAEDDGWLISFVYDLANKRSQVVILNAADVEGEPQAVIHLPVPVPLGFHGNWVADQV